VAVDCVAKVQFLVAASIFLYGFWPVCLQNKVGRVRSKLHSSSSEFIAWNF